MILLARDTKHDFLGGFGSATSDSRENEQEEQGVIMLILTRRVGETLMIGDDVTVTVLSAKGNNIRIGINAPKEVSVHREEVYQKIANQQNEEKQNTAHKAPKETAEAIAQ